MEFRLLYDGPLRAERCESGASARAKDKHLLRKHFHLQLKELWSQHPDLKRQSETSYTVTTTPPFGYVEPVREIHSVAPKDVFDRLAIPYPPSAKTWIDHIADDHQRCGGRFVPLVSIRGGFHCRLDILFLRRDDPGNIISSGGDIDNRLKVLFDGLRMPSTVSELGSLPIEVDENPFFCLLEDDKLISAVTVTTDRLVTPLAPNEERNNVCLVIHVTVINPSAIFAGNRLV